MNKLQPLQLKASAYFDEYQKNYGAQMECAKGCSACCIAGLSVFSWEAQIIVDWFKLLKQKKKLELIDQLTKEKTEPSKCSFLVNDVCTIYEARPIICRTQGAGLSFKTDNGQRQRDWCPLNFINNPPAPSDDLNLDTLNHMSAQAQNIYEATNTSEAQCRNFDKTRVLLSELKKFLLNLN